MNKIEQTVVFLLSFFIAIKASKLVTNGKNFNGKSFENCFHQVK